MAYIGFVEEKGALYCELCYEKFFAPECGRCQRKILGVSAWNCSVLLYPKAMPILIINLFIIFTFYFLLVLSTLSAFFSCVYYKTKLNRPLRKYIRLLGLVVFGFPLLRAGLSGESLATMGKIIYCGCATSAGPCLLRMKKPSRTTHRSFQDWHLRWCKLNSIAFIRAAFPYLSEFKHRTLIS